MLGRDTEKLRGIPHGNGRLERGKSVMHTEHHFGAAAGRAILAGRMVGWLSMVISRRYFMWEVPITLAMTVSSGFLRMTSRNRSHCAHDMGMLCHPTPRVCLDGGACQEFRSVVGYGSNFPSVRSYLDS